MSVRCLIVDDSTLFLETASRILHDGGLTVVGVVSSRAEALAQVQETRPDVALVDVVLGLDSGIDLAHELAADTAPDRTRVILISSLSADDFADLMAETPAIGFLPKSRLSAAAVEELLADADFSDRGDAS